MIRKISPEFFMGLYVLPILFILAFFLFPKSFRRVSHHPLGKCLAILLICLYTYQDKIHGIFVCLLVILYFQMEEKISQKETFLSKVGKNYADYISQPSLKKASEDWEAKRNQEGTLLTEAYLADLPPLATSQMQIFRNTHCKNARPVKKEQPIHASYVHHVYPEIMFQEEHCNPCDPTCRFDVITKQDKEKELLPKETRGSDILWETVEAIFTTSGPKPEAVVVDDIVVSRYES